MRTTRDARGSYDALFVEVEELECRFPALIVPDSPTQRETGVPSPAFPAVRHHAPMLSLQSTTDLAEAAIAPPRACPVCGARVLHRGRLLACPNGFACPAQLRRVIVHFGSRDALDIAGLGPETVDALVSAGIVRSIPDPFRLQESDRRRLGRFRALSARRLTPFTAPAQELSPQRQDSEAEFRPDCFEER